MSKEFETALGEKYYNSIRPEPAPRFSHFCEFILAKGLFRGHIDVVFTTGNEDPFPAEGPVEFAGFHISELDPIATAVAIATEERLARFHDETRPIMMRELVQFPIFGGAVDIPLLGRGIHALGGIATDRSGSLANGIKPRSDLLYDCSSDLMAKRGQSVAIWPGGGLHDDRYKVGDLRPGAYHIAHAAAKKMSEARDEEVAVPIVPTALAFTERSTRFSPHAVLAFGESIAVSPDAESHDAEKDDVMDALAVNL